MAKYIVRRVMVSIPLLFGITFILFLLADRMPGDAIAAMSSDSAPLPEELVAMRRGQLGLDEPIVVQYWDWITQVVQGNLGRSFVDGRPISELIVERLPATLELMGLSLLFSIVVGVTLGVISAVKRYSALDYVLTVGGFVGISVPVFFIGMLLIYVFSLRLGWLPSFGRQTAGEDFSVVDRARHLALPMISLGLLRTAVFMRYTRASVLEVLNEDFVRTARAKGLPERRVLVTHVVRAALLPVVTVIGITLPVVFGGAVIIEQIFQWPGVGLLFIKAIAARDAPLIMGVALMTAVVVLVANLLVDIAYAWIDPRIRYD